MQLVWHGLPPLMICWPTVWILREVMLHLEAGFLRALVAKPAFPPYPKFSNWLMSAAFYLKWRVVKKNSVKDLRNWLVAPGLVWLKYVLLINSIGIYYLGKDVYLIPLSKCVYREAQQYISMLRKHNIRTSMLYFMHVNKGRLLYLICFCKLSGL